MTAGRPTAGWLRQPENLQRLARGVLVLAFLWLAGRFWHPYYGFTKLIQLDQSDAAVMVPELRGAPVYVYPYAGGYDGAAYAQLAVHPAARSPALARAVDSLPYRARRILLSWVAWALGGGDAVRAVQVYAGLNLAVWLALAWVLAVIFPPSGWRNLLAWAGLLFSAGALHSVRLALTDLAAFTLLAGALALGERRRDNPATGLLAAAGLVRETALLGGLALWPRFARGEWRAGLVRLALTAGPLGLWVIYLKLNAGPVVQGLGNFSWPVLGWLAKARTAGLDLGREPDTWLACTTLLAVIGLTVQLAYVVIRRRPDDPWWRLGAVYGLLMLLLGQAVWDGHPGAATRILLPLGLAFNVLAVRRPAALGWLLAGNLTVFSGVLALWQVPQDAHELAAGRSAAGAYVVKTDARWYPAEHGDGRTWAWVAREGGLELDLWPQNDGVISVQLAVRGISPRPLEIRQDGRTLWRGELGAPLQRIALAGVTVAHGRAQLELVSPAAAESEGAAAGGRQLGFALYGVRID